MNNSSLKIVDRLGITASFLCAVHCAAVALTPAIFAALGLDILADHEAEWAFTLFAVFVAGFATFSGFRKHGSIKVLAIFSVGIAFLLASRMTEEMGLHEWGTVIGVVGGLVLVGGHFLNIQTCKSC